MKIIDRIALLLVIVGAVNWGLIGLFQFDAVAWLCGGQTAVISRIIYAESGAETLDGQIAVGNVVLNRMASKEFPDSIPGVIFDRVDGIQFEPVENGTVYKTPSARSVEAAIRVLQGENTIGSAMYFYAPALSQGIWINANRPYLKTIGCHRFYL